MARQNLENEELGGVIRAKINENFEELYEVADGLGTAATADIGTGAGQVIGTNEAKNYFGLDFEPSVKPTISSDFEKNEHKLYEQYGLEPKTINQMYNVERASTATYVDATGKIRTAGVNEPRVDYSSGQGWLLVEEARTNLLTWSEDFSNSVWLKTGNPLVSVGVDSPSGTSKKLTTSLGSSGNHIRQLVSITDTGQDFSFSLLCKQGTSDTVSLRTIVGAGVQDFFHEFVFSTETFSANGTGTSSFTRFGDGWYLVKATLTLNNAGQTSMQVRISASNVSASRVGDVYIAYCQIEQASTPSSYIPTQASAVTRAADNVSRVLGDEFNQDEGTFYVNAIDAIKPPVVSHTFAAGGVPSTSKISVQAHRGRIFILNTTYNITELSNGLDGGFVFTYNKSAGVVRFYIAGNFYEYTNLDLSSFTTDTDIYVGRFSSSTASYDSSFRQVRYYPRALSDQECIQLTKV